jgi:hypothetical protein
MAASASGSLSGANVLIWIGIALCITQSAIFSGYARPLGSVIGRMRVKPAHSEDDDPPFARAAERRHELSRHCLIGASPNRGNAEPGIQNGLALVAPIRPIC